MRIALLVVAALVLVGFVAIGYILPGMAGAEAKNAAQGLLAGADAAKEQVTRAAEKSGGLAGSGRGVKIDGRRDAKLGEMKWVVSEDGEIRGWNGDNAIEITLTPSLKAGKVAWTCKGYPHAVMPAGCGGAGG
jgi:hypothetical protein